MEHWASNPLLNRLFEVVAGLVVVAVVFRLLQKSISRYVSHADTRYRARKVVAFAAYVAILAVFATVFSDRLSRLTVALGVAGAGVALALQELVASLAGMFSIIFGHLYKPGDRIELGGTRGDVIDVSLLRTTLVEIGEWASFDLYSGRVVRIPNSFVFKGLIYNYSADFPFLWDEIRIQVAHGSDYKLAREILQRVADETVGDYIAEAGDSWKNMVQKYLIEDARVEPLLTLTADANSIEFTIRYVVEYKKRRIVKDKLFTSILGEFQETGGRVGLALSSSQPVQAPAGNVGLGSNGKASQ